MVNRREFHATTPKDIIYSQIERVLIARAEGKGALESLSLLSASLANLRDDKYEKRTATLVSNLHNGKDSKEAFYDWYEHLIWLLADKGIWVHGEETW